ncbi:uncharacterized protein LY79DRAFT_504054 [Colletotrichum navitas]|uniref:Fungal specific transcription factor domain containing protein n=1 Tax=Colletotrichum navitas TaxID=681940 RepID=A0AAD8VCH7_9PEZI|nr:uncharacterized protein LY79DRAFT_504054 [Colletotrichum navitas]KAK1600066.1 hypothetical protein LY79DRAFT_504054 [Colletotrichum navitas]
MPPSRPTARCCRAVQQQIGAPLDNIWITDGVLASAFERYCHVSRLARRKSSSVPGPLENRRRLGKRRMTDMHINSQPTLPPWAIEFLPDLRQWTWQPPTKRSSEENMVLPSQQRQFVPWGISRWWTNKVERQQEESDTTAVENQPEIEFRNRLAKARAAVAASTSNAISPAYFNFIGGLQHDIELGILDPEMVNIAVSTFPSSLVGTGVDGEVVNASTEMFLSAVVNGIASSKVFGPTEFDASLWNLVLRQISQLPANDATTLLFKTTLDAIPLHHVDDVHEDIIAAVQKLAVCHSPEDGRAADIGAAFHRLSPADHGVLLDKMETAVYEGSAAFEEEPRQKLRFLWLQILAHMPHVNTDYLLDACVRSAYFDRKELSVDRDLSRLLIQQWTSRGYLWYHKIVEERWDRDSSCHAELNFASLVAHISFWEPAGHRENRRVALLMSLFKALRRLDREKVLMASLQRYCKAKKKLSILPFRNLAMASCDYKIALEIFMLLDDHRAKLKRSLAKQWAWTDWATDHIKSMIEDDSISPAFVWKVVNCGVRRGFLNKVQEQIYMKRRARLMEDMALWFSKKYHRTDAKALRQVCLCIGWLRGHNIALSHKSLVAVLTVVSRELKRGERGRTRRLFWLVNLVEQYQGPEERRAVAKVLERWRRANADLSVCGVDASSR